LFHLVPLRIERAYRVDIGDNMIQIIFRRIDDQILDSHAKISQVCSNNGERQSGLDLMPLFLAGLAICWTFAVVRLLLFMTGFRHWISVN
jgi:hypothetical protein